MLEYFSLVHTRVFFKICMCLGVCFCLKPISLLLPVRQNYKSWWARSRCPPFLFHPLLSFLLFLSLPPSTSCLTSEAQDEPRNDAFACLSVDLIISWLNSLQYLGGIKHDRLWQRRQHLFAYLIQYLDVIGRSRVWAGGARSLSLQSFGFVHSQNVCILELALAVLQTIIVLKLFYCWAFCPSSCLFIIHFSTLWKSICKDLEEEKQLVA